MKLIYSHFFQLCRTLALFHWFQWDQFQSWEFFWYLCSDFLHSSIHRSEYFWQSSLQNASCLGFWRPLAKMSTIVYMIGCFKQNCFVVPLSSYSLPTELSEKPWLKRLKILRANINMKIIFDRKQINFRKYLLFILIII